MPLALQHQLSTNPGATLPERTEALLLDLYSCPAAPAHWTTVLDQLCLETGARSAFVQALRVEGSGMHQYWSAQDTHSCRFILPYVGQLADGANPRLDIRYRPRGVGRFVRDEDLFGREMASLHGYRERLAMLGMGRFMGALWQVDSHNYISVALHRPVDDHNDFSDGQITWLTALAPHLSQAATLAQKFDAANSFNQCLRRHFDCLRCGMVICNDNGHVLWANRSAEQLLAASGAVRLHAGSLLGRSAPATQALLREIAAVAASGNSSHLALDHASQPLHLALHPLADGGEPYREGNSVLLILTTPNSNSTIAPRAVAQLFGLTPAESRLASALVGGFTLEQYALRHGVSLGTVRSQLKHILHKTGVTRQPELVRLLLSSAAAQAAPG